MIRIPAFGFAVACFVSAAAATPLTDPQGCPAPVDFCDAGCYDLGNKVTGVVAPPNYGLRLDGMFGNASDHWTFDFEAPETGVQMCNDGLGTITIEGIAYGGLDVGGAWDPVEQGFLEIHFTYLNASCVNGDLLVLESNGGLAFGTVEWVNTGEVIYLSGKANAAGEIFLFDGHAGDPARGWVMYGDNRVGDFAMTVFPTSDCPPDPDCDGDGIPDSQESDCNQNQVPDDCEELPDCDGNGISDLCEILAGAHDVNQNGIPDVCEPGVEIFCVPDPQTGFTVPCPCGNDVLPGAIGGCLNSTGEGAKLVASGSPSIAAADLLLTVENLPAEQPGIFISGVLPEANGMGAPFRAGVLCITGPIVRLQKVPSSPGGQSMLPANGFDPIWMQVNALPGETHYFQFWFRDGDGPCGGRANLTNALRVTFGI